MALISNAEPPVRVLVVCHLPYLAKTYHSESNVVNWDSLGKLKIRFIWSDPDPDH